MKPPAIFITSDETRGIELIEYNLLGLPERITLSSGEKVVNAYDGRGVKHSTTLLDAAGRTVTKRQYIGDAIIDDGKLTMQLFEGGYLDAAGNAYYYITDWQGNITAVADAAGNIVQSAEYYPDGEPWEEPQGDNRFLLAGKERVGIGGLNMYDFGPRMYNAAACFWYQPDPAAASYPHISPYSYCAGNPVRFVDPSGCRPVYSSKGKFLGTDDTGFEGEVWIVDSEEEGLWKEEDKLKELEVPRSEVSEEVMNTISQHRASLANRPDFDGYLTLEEANEWYRNGNGQALYVDLAKIDLSGLRSLGEEYVNQEKYFNLLTGASGSVNDGLVYGNIKLTRGHNHTVTASHDIYDFDMKPWKTGNLIRNIETIIGSMVAGKGTPYTIYFYGSAHLKPIFPWVK